MKMILGAICVLGVLCSCSDNEEWWMGKTLEMAGTNLLELEKVIGYYGRGSLKLCMTRFLIGKALLLNVPTAGGIMHR